MNIEIKKIPMRRRNTVKSVPQLPEVEEVFAETFFATLLELFTTFVNIL
jgi:hypothetical protein